MKQFNTTNEGKRRLIQRQTQAYVGSETYFKKLVDEAKRRRRKKENRLMNKLSKIVQRARQTL